MTMRICGLELRHCPKCGVAAPSACNRQPWEYYVVTNKEKITELSQTSPYATCAKDAPLVFVACYRQRETLIAPSYAEIEDFLMRCNEMEPMPFISFPICCISNIGELAEKVKELGSIGLKEG